MIFRKLSDGHTGPTFACLIGQQFQKLKYGDRFWFENDEAQYTNAFTANQKAAVSRVTLAKVRKPHISPLQCEGMYWKRMQVI